MYYTLISNPASKLSGIFHIDSVEPKEEGIHLYFDGEDLGYLVNTSPKSLLPGSVLANLTSEQIVGNAFIMLRRKSSEAIFYLVDLFPTKFSVQEGKTDSRKLKDPISLFFTGSQVKYPKKRELLRELEEKGSADVRIKLELGKLYALNGAGEKVGVIVEGQTFPDIFTETAMVDAVATPMLDERTNYRVTIAPAKKSSQDDSSLHSMIVKLNEACIDHPQNLTNKIRFLKENGIDDFMIMKVLESHLSYEGKDRFKIKHPEFPYIDTANGYLRRVISYMLAGENTRLVGDKGCGKNTMLDTLSWLFNKPLFKIGCSERTDEYTIFGSTQVKNGDTVHRLSPFAHGLTIGAICVLDEANMVPAELMSAINQIADDTREVDINNYGLLKVHPDTRIFMTMNEEYEGVVTMNDATVDRFQGVFMESSMSIAKLLTYLVPEASKDDVGICAKVFDKIKEQVNEQGALSPSAITIRGYKAALRARQYLPLKDCLIDAIAGRLQDSEEREIVKTIITSFCV